jgi:hypothetical protein
MIVALSERPPRGGRESKGTEFGLPADCDVIVCGIALPDDVLKKLYFGNALKVIPGLSRAGFPQ